MTGIIEQDPPRARLAALLQHFSDLDDSREPWRVMYPLKEVLPLVTCATIASKKKEPSDRMALLG